MGLLKKQEEGKTGIQGPSVRDAGATATREAGGDSSDACMGGAVAQ